MRRQGQTKSLEAREQALSRLKISILKGNFDILYAEIMMSRQKLGTFLLNEVV